MLLIFFSFALHVFQFDSIFDEKWIEWNLNWKWANQNTIRNIFSVLCSNDVIWTKIQGIRMFRVVVNFKKKNPKLVSIYHLIKTVCRESKKIRKKKFSTCILCFFIIIFRRWTHFYLCSLQVLLIYKANAELIHKFVCNKWQRREKKKQTTNIIKTFQSNMAHITVSNRHKCVYMNSYQDVRFKKNRKILPFVFRSSTWRSGNPCLQSSLRLKSYIFFLTKSSYPWGRLGFLTKLQKETRSYYDEIQILWLVCRTLA